MNKSKFLKKSLALLLAFMLVFAMIPLGAAAAEYKPTGTVKPALVDPTSGTLTGSGNTWNVDFKYSADLPSLKVEYETVGDRIFVIRADGTEEEFAAANTNETKGLPVERDDKGNPVPFVFVVKNAAATDRSAEYTVTWTMPEPSATGKATSAKLDGKYDGEIDEAEKTITFTVPFGYGGAKKYEINYEGCKHSTIAPLSAFGGTVGTNMKNADGELVDNETQTGNNEVDYTVIIKEEAGLTSFTFDDYEAEFVIGSSAGNTSIAGTSIPYDAGCQTGVIKVYIPADLGPDSNGKLMLTPNFTLDPVSHLEVTLEMLNAAGNGWVYPAIENGVEIDFAKTLANPASGTGLVVTITNTDEVSSTRKYLLQLARDVTDTTIDSFTAFGLEGTVNGTNLDAEISPSNNIAAVTLAFVGPKDPGVGIPGRTAAPKIEVVNGAGTNVSKNTTFGTDGKTVANLTLDCTKPVYLKVTSADTTKQQTYTLTVKKAAQETLVPQVLTAKLILNYGLSNETTHIGKVDQNAKTITFSDIPYSATDAQARAGVYSFSKTPLTSCDWENNVSNVTIANNKERIKVVTTGAQAQEAFYDVKFEKAAARTGKSISEFILTEATNIHEVGYNNNKTYDVKATVKANDESTFEVTVPTGTTINSYFADFTLDGGAKMYEITGQADTYKLLITDEVTVNFEADTGAKQGTAYMADSDKFLIADEKLATAITAGDASVDTLTKLKNNYPSNYTIYTMKVATRDKKNNAILTAISADDGLVKGEVVNVPVNSSAKPGEITLTVPYSYVTAGFEKEFFFDYTVSDGANLVILDKTSGSDNSALISGGMVQYNLTSGALEPVQKSWTSWGVKANNPSFKVKVIGGKAILHAVHTNGLGDVALEAVAPTMGIQLAVVAEDTSADLGYYTIKEVKVADPIKDDKLSTVKANNVNATVDNSAKTVKVSLPFGTNLGQVKLDIVPSSKLAKVQVLDKDGVAIDPPAATYDLSYARKIKVTADSGDYSTYTLTATLGTMFSDVPESAWYYQYVLDAANKGLVTGYEDGTFKPMNNITRGDFALIVTRMLGVDEDDLEYVTTPFSDVNDKTYNAKAISYCAENGFISGYEDGTFKPTKNISRQEAAKVLATALKLSGTTAEKFKDDATIASWASGYVYACKAAGIIDGDNYGNFNPKKMITRAETAKLMVEALNNK